MFENGVARLVAEITRRDLGNVRIFPDDARLLLERAGAGFARAGVHPVSRPLAETRHHKRRLVATATLDRLAVLMRPGAELWLATDDRDIWGGCWSTRPASEVRVAGAPSADWRERPADWPPTRYEEKALAAGRTPAFLPSRARADRVPNSLRSGNFCGRGQGWLEIR